MERVLGWEVVGSVLGGGSPLCFPYHSIILSQTLYSLNGSLASAAPTLSNTAAVSRTYNKLCEMQISLVQ